MTGMLGLYIAIFAAALGALLSRSRLANHLLLGLTGLFGLLYSLGAHGLLGAILPFLILIVAAVQAASVVGANRAAKFDDDEKAMLSGPLAGLARSQARRLIDQGMWIEGSARRCLDPRRRAGRPALFPRQRRRRRPRARQSGWTGGARPAGRRSDGAG